MAKAKPSSLYEGNNLEKALRVHFMLKTLRLEKSPFTVATYQRAKDCGKLWNGVRPYWCSLPIRRAVLKQQRPEGKTNIKVGLMRWRTREGWTERERGQQDTRGTNNKDINYSQPWSNINTEGVCVWVRENIRLILYRAHISFFGAVLPTLRWLEPS